MITSSGFGESSLPQNLGMDQKIAPTAIYWGRGGAYGTLEESIFKAPYQFCRSLPLNDRDTLGARDTVTRSE